MSPPATRSLRTIFFRSFTSTKDEEASCVPELEFLFLFREFCKANNIPRTTNSPLINLGKNLELTIELFSTATMVGIVLLKKKTVAPKAHKNTARKKSLFIIICSCHLILRSRSGAKKWAHRSTFFLFYFFFNPSSVLIFS